MSLQYFARHTLLMVTLELVWRAIAKHRILNKLCKPRAAWAGRTPTILRALAQKLLWQKNLYLK